MIKEKVRWANFGWTNLPILNNKCVMCLLLCGVLHIQAQTLEFNNRDLFLLNGRPPTHVFLQFWFTFKWTKAHWSAAYFFSLAHAHICHYKNSTNEFKMPQNIQMYQNFIVVFFMITILFLYGSCSENMTATYPCLLIPLFYETNKQNSYHKCTMWNKTYIHAVSCLYFLLKKVTLKV